MKTLSLFAAVVSTSSVLLLTSCVSPPSASSPAPPSRSSAYSAFNEPAFAISPTSAAFPSTAGSGSVGVTSTWTAHTSASWITLTSDTNGTGNGTVSYSVAANPGAARSGIITIAGQTFTVSQSGGTDPGPWVKRSGGASDDIGRTIACDSAGNVFAAGYYSGTANFAGTSLTSAGGADLYLAKYSSSGSQQWVKGFGSSGNEMVTSIALDSSGNIYLGGYFLGAGNFGGATLTSAGGYDMFLAKYSPLGAHLWSQRFGGTRADMINGIAVDSQGNVVVTGTFQGTVSVGGATWRSVFDATDLFLAKYSSQGAHIWSKTFANDGDETSRALALDSNGNIFLAGHAYGLVDFGGGWLSTDSYDIFLAKFNAVGGYLWAKKYGGPGGQRAVALAVDSAGDAVVAGNFSGGMNAGGGTAFTSSDTDSFLAKYSGADGSYQWAKSVSGLKTQEPSGVAVDAQRNIILTGYFDGSAALGTATLTSAGVRDIYAAKHTPAGTLTWAKSFGGANFDLSNALAVDPNGYSLVTGAFSGTASFGGTSLTSAGASDIFLLRIAP